MEVDVFSGWSGLLETSANQQIQNAVILSEGDITGSPPLRMTEFIK